jgi:hypothetical protein
MLFVLLCFVFHDNHAVMKMVPKNHMVHTFVFFRVSGSPYYSEISQTWKAVQEAFKEDPKVAVVDVDCDKRGWRCRALDYESGGVEFQYRFNNHVFPLIFRNVSRGGILNQIQELVAKKNTTTCPLSPNSESRHPYFVWRPQRVDIACKIMARYWHVFPNNIYVLPAMELSSDMSYHFDSTRFFSSRPGSAPSSLWKFFQDFTLSTLGDWWLGDIPQLERRFGFVVYENDTQVQNLRPLFEKYETHAIFGKIHIDKAASILRFRKFIASEIPIVILTNKRRKCYVVESKEFPMLERIMENWINGNLEGLMQIDAYKIGKESWKINWPFFWFSAALCLFVISGTVWVIVRDVTYCVNFGGRRPAAFV